MKVAIIGSGAIGSSWAIVFAQAGNQVLMWDPAPQAATAALGSISAQLAQLARAGLLDETPAAVLARISTVASLQDAVGGAGHIQENGPENLDVRRRLFAELDAAASPDAVIASSTSGMAPSTFTEELPGRHRCLVAHPANPPYLLPLVELCPAPWTAPEVLDNTRTLMLGAGRKVAVLQREAEGFLLNRLQGALLAEAFRIVADGIAGPDDVDTVMKSALGLRWSFLGPFETVDLNAPGGISDFCARYGALYENLQKQMPPRQWDAALVDTIAAARRADVPLADIPQRQAWRDDRLMALAVYLKTQPTS
jgi:L-gulonate 3-dehydrogenase